jgi:hypothetical protein
MHVDGGVASRCARSFLSVENIPLSSNLPRTRHPIGPVTAVQTADTLAFTGHVYKLTIAKINTYMGIGGPPRIEQHDIPWLELRFGNFGQAGCLLRCCAGQLNTFGVAHHLLHKGAAVDRRRGGAPEAVAGMFVAGCRLKQSWLSSFALLGSWKI